MQKAISAGTIEKSPNYDPKTDANDGAIIRWKDGVTINSNTLDRDGIVPISQLHKSQQEPRSVLPRPHHPRYE
ncbi:S1 family peptidase [Corynebacterium sp. HMSC29G08]|uniref:S1 family peptidase n=1 Tax=Corynebacterium sp. HMSC29G08 TaxID=1581069 RepID=UPI00114CDB16|nr:S1 family peptidase [Corynebacterium sp. HMSC29G08]